MAQVIHAQAVIPLLLHVSGSTGPGLSITGVSLGDNPHILPLAADIPVASSASFQTFSHAQTPLPAEHPANWLEFIQPDESIQCAEHDVKAYLLGESPSMVYIEDFLTEEERLHLITVSEGNYVPANVYNGDTHSTSSEESYRRSETAMPQRNSLVKCIEHRARSLHAQFLQRWHNAAFEPFTVQRYQKDGFFAHHLDAIEQSPLPNRKSTFNVWLDGNCTGGGTHFPAIPRWEDPALCYYLDCEAMEEGTVFKPIAGNALFWENIRADGTVYEDMVHAGLPVQDGTKIGLNIWPWEFALGDPRGNSWP